MNTLTINDLKSYGQILKQIKDLLTRANKGDLMTPEDVAEITGYSLATVYTLVHKRTIPYYRNKSGGNKLHFSRKEIEEWTLHRRVRTIEEEIEYDEQFIGKRNRRK